MSIKCNLSVLMGKHKYNIQDVHLRTGLSRATISNLYHDRMERIDYSTLSKLCRLFNCEVSDILEFIDEEYTSN
ncbi:XRE family transcriptional regulator [Candidatus Parcubacteria bacterium]|jgi:putative transcriptional regulator|nr:MAG: XRE family transcriptional regulator [Candidatus Parcubacteria bacterium]